MCYICYFTIKGKFTNGVFRNMFNCKEIIAFFCCVFKNNSWIVHLSEGKIYYLFVGMQICKIKNKTCFSKEKKQMKKICLCIRKNARMRAVEAEYKCCLHKLTMTANRQTEGMTELGIERLRLQKLREPNQYSS